MDLLLLSSSKAGQGEYLASALPMIAKKLVGRQQVLFIPYAGVSLTFEDYCAKVQAALQPIGVQIHSIHQQENPVKAVQTADAIIVGGGNTFALLKRLYDEQLVEAIRDRVTGGAVYIGWSAGSNIAGLSIKTTNDMPIVEPPSFAALGLVPYQLNPHYRNENIAGFHGETRDMRLAEFMQLNPQTAIIALPEGTALELTHSGLRYLGTEAGFIFQQGDKTPIAPNEWLQKREV